MDLFPHLPMDESTSHLIDSVDSWTDDTGEKVEWLADDWLKSTAETGTPSVADLDHHGGFGGIGDDLPSETPSFEQFPSPPVETTPIDPNESIDPSSLVDGGIGL